MRRFALLLTLALAVSSFGVSSAQQQELGVAVSPAIIEVTGDPGDELSGSVTFGNTHSSALVGFMQVDTLIPIDDIVDEARRSQFDASSWITLSEPNLLFEAESQQELGYTIAIPDDANPGGHYALITLKPGQIESVQSDTAIVPELSASVFITVSGDIREQAEVVDEDLDIGNITKGSSRDVSFRIRNNGNVHLLPSPRIRISRGEELIELIQLQPQLILPNTEKTFSTEWQSSLDYGTYEINAELTYGSEGTPLTSEKYSFSVVPNFVQIALLLSLIPLLLFLIIKRKNIPRMMAVLRGHAHIRGKNYKLSGGDEDLPKLSKDAASTAMKEVAAEMEREKPKAVLGYPDTKQDTYFSDTRNLSDESKKEKPKPSKVLSTTVSTSHGMTTHITQTSSSTIVREKSPFFDPDVAKTQETRKITIQDADKLSKKKTPVKKSTTKKKSTPKKKSTATAKKKATTKATKTSSTKKKTTPKKASSKKPSTPKKKSVK